LAGSALVGIVGPAWAAEYIFTPSLELRETYDDNVFLRDIDDFEHLIAPALTLDARTDRAHWQTSAAWDISEYQRHSELDTVDQAYQVSVDMAPRDVWQVSLTGQYVDDYTFRSALEESGIVAERSKRKSATVEPGVAVVLNPRNTLTWTYEFNKTQYRFEDYPDYRVHGLHMSWFHDLLNERSRVIGTVGASEVDFEADYGDTTQRTYRALAGLDHRFSDTLHVQLTAGIRYTESEFPRTEVVFDPPDQIRFITKTVEENDSGFIVDGTLDWRLEKVGLSATVNRDVAPSIYGEIVTRDRVRAGLTYHWSEKLRWRLSSSYHLSETEGVIQEEEYETYMVRPSMVYQFNEAIDLQLGYSYTWTENRITDRSEDRNRIFAELRLAWPKQID
jgi:hypothetical protein